MGFRLSARFSFLTFAMTTPLTMKTRQPGQLLLVRDIPGLLQAADTNTARPCAAEPHVR